MSDWLDEDGYPTDEALEKIEKWDFHDFRGLMGFVFPIWKYHEPDPAWCGWHRHGRKYWLDTGGWSGNESIIEALKKNLMFMAMCWQESKRGGHYKFELPKWK